MDNAKEASTLGAHNTLMEQARVGLRAQYMFVSEEMERLAAKMKEIETKQDELQKQLREHGVVIVNKNFSKASLDHLIELESQEVALAVEFMSTYKRLMEETQSTRRKRLFEEQARISRELNMADRTVATLGAPTSIAAELSRVDSKLGVSTANELFKQSVFAGTIGGASSGDFDAELGAINIGTWELQLSELHFDQSEHAQLGRGSYGHVVRGELRQKPVAIKVISVPSWGAEMNEKTQAVLRDFRNECAVMCKLLHPNVLLLMGVCMDTEKKKLIMVTELMEGSVSDKIHKTPVSFKERIKYAKDCALGMAMLHLSNPPIMHLDLKTANLLVDKNGVVKVADFGLSKVVGPKEKNDTVGSPLYMAPEVLDSVPYDQRADIYSYGIILWELVMSKVPYQSNGFASGYRGVIQLIQHVMGGGRPELPKDDQCPARLITLMQECWDQDPSKRPSFKSILESRVLDDAIVDAVITNQANHMARDFWKANFVSRDGIKEVVSWEEFAPVVASFIGLAPAPSETIFDHIIIKALKLLLVNKGRVRIEQFNAVVEWFGPFDNTQAMVDRMIKTFKMEGFWGVVGSSEVPNLLAGQALGTYIIRFSSELGAYTLTVVDNAGIQNYRIQHKAGKRFALGNPPRKFKSLSTLIKAFKSDLHLERPLPASPYNRLFVEHDADLENNYTAPLHVKQKRKKSKTKDKH